MSDQANVNYLQDTITAELLSALGLPAKGPVAKLASAGLWWPTLRFARLVARFDRAVEVLGFTEASRRVLPYFVTDIKVRNDRSIPSRGPLLLVSNHPGNIDALAIASRLPRNDLKIIVSDVPFLRGATSLKKHLIYTSLTDHHHRLTAVRQMLRHLRAGGSMLVYPSGRLDPDPAVLPGAENAIDHWSPSLALALKRVPQVTVQVAVVSGVLTPTIAHSRLVTRRPTLKSQLMFAEFTQMLLQVMFGVRFSLAPTLTFDRPMSSADYGPAPEAQMDAIRLRARQVLADHMLAIGHGSRSFGSGGLAPI